MEQRVLLRLHHVFIICGCQATGPPSRSDGIITRHTAVISVRATGGLVGSVVGEGLRRSWIGLQQLTNKVKSCRKEFERFTEEQI